MTATFFNVKYLKKQLVEGSRVMLSGEVGYFKGTMQLTHPAFLILHASGKMIGTKSLKTIASASGATGDELLSAFEQEFFPIYGASKKLQTWDIYACVRQVLDVLDPIADPLPEPFVRQHNLISEDEALRAIHLAENDDRHGTARGTGSLSTRPSDCSGRWWAAATASCSETGPAVPYRGDGLAAAMRSSCRSS